MSERRKTRREGLGKDARARLARAATAVSRDEWNRAYADALRLYADRQAVTPAPLAVLRDYGTAAYLRGEAIYAVEAHSVHVDRLQGERV